MPRFTVVPGARLRRASCVTAHGLVWWLLFAALAGGAARGEESTRRRFDIPAGAAVVTLKRAAQQAGIEIVYSAAVVRDVQTRAVAGEFAPREALERMVAATPLRIFPDPRTRALSILRTPGPDPRSPTPTPPPKEPPRPMKLKKFTALVSSWIVLALGSAPATHAADGSPAGAIEGRVLNSRSGEYFEKARLTVEGTQIEAFTDSSGQYRLQPVPAGPAKVKVFFTGLEQLVATVIVPAGDTVSRDFDLGAPRTGTQPDGTVKLDAFVVATSKEMSAAALAINEQRFAPNIKNVLSTDEFGLVAEGNSADFLKFLPGITIENSGGNSRDVSINGVPSANVPITLDGFSVASSGVGDTNTGRAVAMDMMSVNNLSRIEVEYSPTPESQGAALAGTVNMVSRSAFERARPVLNTSAFVVTRSTEHDFNRTPGPRTTPSRKIDPGFDFSYIAPVNKRFGFTFSGGTSTNFSPEPLTQTLWRGTSGATGGNFPATTPDQPYLTSYTYRDATKVTTRNSLGATLDFKLSGYDRLSLGYQFSYFHLYASNQTLGFVMNRVLPGEFSLLSTRSAPGQAELQLTNLIRDRHNRTHMPTLIWRHDGPVWKGDFGLGYSRSTNANRDIDKGLFQNTTGFRRNLTIAFDGMLEERPDKITVIDNATGAVIDPYAITGKSFNTAAAIQNDTSDVQRTAYANLGRDFYGRVPVRLKAGLHVRQSQRDSLNRNTPFAFLGADGNAATEESATPFLDPVYAARSGVYGLPAIQGISNARTWEHYRANPTQYSINRNNDYRSIVTSSKFAEELISSGYLRGDANFLDRRLRLVGGVRAEQTNIEAEGPLSDPTRNYERDSAGRVLRAPNGAPLLLVPASNALGVSQLTFLQRSTHASKEYLRLFPSLNISYNVRENLIARAAVYRSVGRPNFNQYAGGVTLPDAEELPSLTNRIVVNNVGIKAWSADTLNLRLEYYFAGVGQLSVNAFRRDFTNFFGATRFAASPAFLALYDVDANTYGQFDVETQYNVPGTVRMEGASLNYKQALTFLPEWARGVQVFANASTQRRTGTLVGDSSFNFFPRSGSWGVSLTRPKYSVRFNWNYRGERRTAAVTGAGLPADNFTWMPKRLTLDAQAEYTFYKRYAAFIILRNATNVPDDNLIYNSFTPSAARFRNRIDYGALWTLGVKGTF